MRIRAYSNGTVIGAGPSADVVQPSTLNPGETGTFKLYIEHAYLSGTIDHYEIAEQLVIHTPAKIAAKIENIKPIPDGFHPPTLEGATEELKKLSVNARNFAIERYSSKNVDVIVDTYEKLEK